MDAEQDQDLVVGITSVASRGPQPAITPSAIARSVDTHSRVPATTPCHR